MKKIELLIGFVAISYMMSAQSLGIGTDPPHPSAMLEVKSYTKGILIPRTSTESRLAIEDPAKGLMLYDTTTGSFWFHNGTEWNEITNARNPNGNGGTNTFLGFGSGKANTTAGKNTAIGANALQNQSFSNGDAEWETTNVAVGFEALTLNNPTSKANGISNTAVGTYALRNNTIGFDNTALGAAALYYNDKGYQNTAIGRQALFSNSAGENNTAIGFKALRNSNARASYNTANGAFSLFSNAGAHSNTASGYYSLYSNTTGASNTASGYQALMNNITGSGNTAFGSQSGPNAANFSNTTCLGYEAISTANNQVVLGNPYVTQLYCHGAFAGTTALAANLVVLNNGQIVRSTSSRRYKKDIVPIDINTANIYQLTPVSYNSYTDDSRHFGLIAEEVAEIIPELAMYSKEKEVVKGSSSEKMIPDAVQYPLLSVLILKEVQKHEQAIGAQQLIMEEQNKKIDLLLKELQGIKEQLNNCTQKSK